MTHPNRGTRCHLVTRIFVVSPACFGELFNDSSVQNAETSDCRRRRLFFLNQVSVGPLSLALIVVFESSVGGVRGHFILRVGYSDPGVVISPGIVRADGGQHDKMT